MAPGTFVKGRHCEPGFVGRGNLLLSKKGLPLGRELGAERLHFVRNDISVHPIATYL